MSDQPTLVTLLHILPVDDRRRLLLALTAADCAQLAASCREILVLLTSDWRFWRQMYRHMYVPEKDEKERDLLYWYCKPYPPVSTLIEEETGESDDEFDELDELDDDDNDNEKDDNNTPLVTGEIEVDNNVDKTLPESVNWFRVLGRRMRTEKNWRSGKFVRRIQSLPRPSSSTTNDNWKLLAANLSGILLERDPQKVLYAIWLQPHTTTDSALLGVNSDDRSRRQMPLESNHHRNNNNRDMCAIGELYELTQPRQGPTRSQTRHWMTERFVVQEMWQDEEIGYVLRVWLRGTTYIRHSLYVRHTAVSAILGRWALLCNEWPGKKEYVVYDLERGLRCPGELMLSEGSGCLQAVDECLAVVLICQLRSSNGGGIHVQWTQYCFGVGVPMKSTPARVFQLSGTIDHTRTHTLSAYRVNNQHIVLYHRRIQTNDILTLHSMCKGDTFTILPADDIRLVNLLTSNLITVRSTTERACRVFDVGTGNMKHMYTLREPSLDLFPVLGTLALFPTPPAAKAKAIMGHQNHSSHKTMYLEDVMTGRRLHEFPVLPNIGENDSFKVSPTSIVFLRGESRLLEVLDYDACL